MAEKRKKIIIANWKMKLSLFETTDLARKVKNVFQDISDSNIVLAPNFMSLMEVGRILEDTDIKLCAQDVFWEDRGAFTGEISPRMLVEAGCQYVIIGHSERREFLKENYEIINKKTKAVLATPELTPILCIGENWDERKTDRRDFILFDQLQQGLADINIEKDEEIIIAYEPIWAIGSGAAIEPTEAEYAHKIVKITLTDMFGEKVVNNNFRLIYGGSINSKNVSSFINLENIDGLLVGGASLDEKEFYKVAKIIFNF